MEWKFIIHVIVVSFERGLKWIYLFSEFFFTNHESVESDGIQYKPVKQSFYRCSESPHTGESNCPCIHCHDSCAPGEERMIQRKLPKFKGENKTNLFKKITTKNLIIN